MDTGSTSSTASARATAASSSRNNYATTVHASNMANSLGPNGTLRAARRPSPNASTTTSRSARQRLSEAGDFVEEGGEYYDAIAPSASNKDSFESAATGNSSIVSDPDPDM